MGPALSHSKINNRRFATPAGLALMAVDAQGLLHTAAGIDPIKRRTVVLDGLSQHVYDGSVQGADGRSAQSIRTLKGVQSCPKQRLVSIDISEASDAGLIEQEGL